MEIEIETIFNIFTTYCYTVEKAPHMHISKVFRNKRTKEQGAQPALGADGSRLPHLSSGSEWTVRKQALNKKDAKDYPSFRLQRFYWILKKNKPFQYIHALKSGWMTRMHFPK